jgi:hypothetical protein
MTTLGQSVGFSGRAVGFVIDGTGAAGSPWKFEFPSKDGNPSFIEVLEASGLYFEYIPTSAPTGFNAAGGDLVAFSPCEAKFQQFPGPFTEGVKIDTWLIYGWVTFTMHFAGALYPDTTPYAILVDPEDANCYVACIGSELTRIR